MAFAEIYDRYNKPLYRYVISLVKLPDMTEDIVQDVFLKIWEIKEKLEIKEHLRGYLFRCCHNKVADTAKRIAGERNLREQLRHQYLLNQLAGDQYSFEDLRRYDDLIEEAMNTLSPQRRRVFELHRIERKSHAEIARELQISPNTVKEHMSKAESVI